MKTKQLEKYAMVTGASKVLGKEIAIELARHNHNLLFVALQHENLEEMSHDKPFNYFVVGSPV